MVDIIELLLRLNENIVVVVSSSICTCTKQCTKPFDLLNHFCSRISLEGLLWLDESGHCNLV